MKKRFEILVVGELNVDIIFNGIDSLPRVGTEILAREMALTLGSSSAIMASNISTLGVSTAFIGRIGTDVFGELVTGSLGRKGVDTSMIKSLTTSRTGATVVMNYGNDRAMVTHAGAMEEMMASDITDDELLSASHMHVSSVFLQPGLKKGIAGLFERAKKLGLTTSLDVQWDPSERWDLDLEKLLPFVDVFLPNESEILALTGRGTIESALDELRPFANTIALKLGKDGSVGYRKDQRLIAAPYLNEHVVDAIGAGDSFNAGFLSAYVQGMPLKDCLERGNIMGAVNTTGVGGTGAFTSLEDVKRTAFRKFNYKF